MVVQPWLGLSADLQEEIVLSSGEPITKKLPGQLSRARELGLRTCLAIDQRGSSGLKFGANFMPHARTIFAAVDHTERLAEIAFDIVVLVRNDDMVTWSRI